MRTEDRLEAMQKELNTMKRRFRWIIAVGSFFIFGVWVFGAMPGKSVQASVGEILSADVVIAQRFQVLNDQNKSRASLGVISGEPALYLSDSRGEVRGSFVLMDGNPSLSLSDAQGNERIFFGVLEGNPILRIYDAKRNVIWSAP